MTRFHIIYENEEKNDEDTITAMLLTEENQVLEMYIEDDIQSHVFDTIDELENYLNWISNLIDNVNI